MELCNQCVQKLYQKLTQVDILTLASLSQATNAGTALTRSAILGKVKEVYNQATMHYILNAVKRLELIGFVMVTKSGRQELVYSTEDGLCAIKNYGNGIENVYSRED